MVVRKQEEKSLGSNCYGEIKDVMGRHENTSAGFGVIVMLMFFLLNFLVFVLNSEMFRIEGYGLK